MSVVIPDIEAAVITYLLDDLDLGSVVSDRIYAELPDGVVYPCLTVAQISDRAGVPRWPVTVTLQVSGWGHRNATGARQDARDACEYAVRALNNLANTEVGDALICGPLATFGHGSRPDQISAGVINPRFITDVTLTYHPVPTGS